MGCFFRERCESVDLALRLFHQTDSTQRSLLNRLKVLTVSKQRFDIKGGESLLDLPAVIRFPFYEDGQQLFPFRTFIMLASILVQIVVSLICRCLSVGGHLPLAWDVLQCFPQDATVVPVDGVELEEEAAVIRVNDAGVTEKDPLSL